MSGFNHPELDRSGYILEDFYRNFENAESLYGFIELNMFFIDFIALFLQLVGNHLGCNSSENPILFANLNRNGQGQRIQFIGHFTGFLQCFVLTQFFQAQLFLQLFQAGAVGDQRYALRNEIIAGVAAFNFDGIAGFA